MLVVLNIDDIHRSENEGTRIAAPPVVSWEERRPSGIALALLR